MKCSKCRRRIEPDDSFCPKCGHNNENYTRIKIKEIEGEVHLNPKKKKYIQVIDSKIPDISDIKINTIRAINDVENYDTNDDIKIQTNEVKQDDIQKIVEMPTINQSYPKSENKKQEEVQYNKPKPNYQNNNYINQNKPNIQYNNYSKPNNYNFKQKMFDNDNQKDETVQNYEIGSYILASVAFIFFFIFPIFSIILSAIGLSLAHYINSQKAKITNIVALVISFIATIIFLSQIG